LQAQRKRTPRLLPDWWGHGADAGLSGELVLGLEALAYVTEFGQDLGGA